MTSYQFVFSIDGRPYQNWQAQLQKWSHRKEGMPGECIALTDVWQRTRSQEYLGMNKPYALAKFSERNDLADVIVVTDPDCVYQRYVDFAPEPGLPWGQRSPVLDPMGHFRWLAKFTPDPGALQKVNCIWAYRREDFKRIMPRYLSWTEAIYEDLDSWERINWCSDMYGYCIAAQELGLKHREVHVSRTNLEGIDDAPILHFAYENTAANGWRWHKWEYKPWEPVPDPPPDDHAVDPVTRAFVKVLNAHVDEVRSLSIPAPPYPQA